MEKPPPPNLEQNTLIINPYKSEESYPQKAKGMSFIAFVCSIFIYISIFYIFSLSPSKLVNNTNFWFFISNTLIIILLVDYGAFSSPKDDLYKEYIMRRQHNAASLRRQHSHIIRTSIPEEEIEEFCDHKNKFSPQRVNNSDKNLALISTSSSNSRSSSFNGKNKNITKRFQRSKSDIVKRVVIDESKNIIRRVETDHIYDHNSQPDDPPADEEENNKYANMSDEELNRRVEEFIQGFNKQIRLQRDV